MSPYISNYLLRGKSPTVASHCYWCIALMHPLAWAPFFIVIKIKMPFTTHSQNHTNNNKHFLQRSQKNSLWQVSKNVMLPLQRNRNRKWQVDRWNRCVSWQINRKASCNPLFLLSFCSIRGPTDWPGLTCWVTPWAGSWDTSSNFNPTHNTGAQTREPHRCNLISRSISSTKGGNCTAKYKPWISVGTLFIFNFQMVRIIWLFLVRTASKFKYILFQLQKQEYILHVATDF